MALSKQRKEEVMSQYQEWLGKSQAVILVEYTGARMKDVDAIRAKVRETGGEFHVIKNTLVKRILSQSGFEIPSGMFENSTAAVFAFEDPASTTKALTDVTKGRDFIKVKGGYLDKKTLSVNDVKVLAALPPLPVIRAQLLGVLQAPASKLVRTIAEPARSVAAVIGAYADQATPSAA